MHRCFELASHGLGFTAPNPVVGAVLVYKNEIIGEGWHRYYGGPHAEVNCLESVASENKYLIKDSTLYVSLEPCTHYGKTPPCTNLILEHEIKKVVIGCRDPFKQVNGKGVEILRKSGVRVTEGILEKEATEINKRFFIFHEQQRPFIILKWADTADGYMAPLQQKDSSERWLISGSDTNRFVHKLRKEQAAILVGTNTVLWDNPVLNNRYVPGKSPIRLIIDKNLSIPLSHKIFNTPYKTYIFNYLRDDKYSEYVEFIKLTADKNFIPELMASCYGLGIQSILVEGGLLTISSFIENGLFDEIVQIKSKKNAPATGLKSPLLPADLNYLSSLQLAEDQITIWKRKKVL